jgi:hypothetical protein
MVLLSVVTFFRSPLRISAFAFLSTVLMALFAGCYVQTWGYTTHTSFQDSVLGEEHEVNFAAHDALLLTEDALRGDGILFEVKSDNSLVTLWRKADQPAGFFQSLVGVTPRYRYEIQVVSQGSHKSKIIVNVRTDGIADEDAAKYKASARFDLFKEIDELAAKYPPPSRIPSVGGVNFTVLPNEDLKAFARRVTGNAENWRQIAKDNGLSAATDVKPFESVWVNDRLLKPAPKTAPQSSP